MKVPTVHRSCGADGGLGKIVDCSSQAPGIAITGVYVAREHQGVGSFSLWLIMVGLYLWEILLAVATPHVKSLGAP